MIPVDLQLVAAGLSHAKQLHTYNPSMMPFTCISAPLQLHPKKMPPHPSQQGIMKPPCYLVSEADETQREKKSYVQGSVCDRVVARIVSVLS